MINALVDLINTAPNNFLMLTSFWFFSFILLLMSWYWLGDDEDWEKKEIKVCNI